MREQGSGIAASFSSRFNKQQSFTSLPYGVDSIATVNPNGSDSFSFGLFGFVERARGAPNIAVSVALFGSPCLIIYF